MSPSMPSASADIHSLKWIPFETQNFWKYRARSDLGRKPKAKA